MSLMVTDMMGFMGRKVPGPMRMRYAGAFSLTYVGATGTATITGLQYDPSEFRQLIIFVHTNNFFINGCSVSGNKYHRLGTALDGSCRAFGGQAAAAGNPVVTITAGGSGNSTNSIEVYEVENALPFPKCLSTFPGTGSGSTHEAVRPIGSVLAAAADRLVASGTNTWTGPTEDSDYDAGDTINTSASLTTPVTSKTRSNVLCTPSASTSGHSAIVPLPLGYNGVSCIPERVFSLSVAGNVGTHVSNIDTANLPACKAVYWVMSENDITVTGVTFNGVAMTQIASGILNTSASPDLNIQVYQIDLPPQSTGTTTPTVDVTFSGAPTAPLGQLLFVFDCGSITTGTSSGNSTGSAFNLQTVEGSFILGLSNWANAATTITWTGMNEWYDGTYASGNAAFGVALRGCCETEAARSIQAVGNTSGQYATMALSFNP